MNKKKLFKLTDNQAEQFKVLQWLISDDEKDRITGRTTLLAMAFMQKALDNRGTWVTVFDHYPDRYSEDRMIHTITQLVPVELRDSLTINDTKIIFK